MSPGARREATEEQKLEKMVSMVRDEIKQAWSEGYRVSIQVRWTGKAKAYNKMVGHHELTPVDTVNGKASRTTKTEHGMEACGKEGWASVERGVTIGS